MAQKKIRAILVDPENREVKEVQVTPNFWGEGGMYEMLDCSVIEQYIVTPGVAMLFDEEGRLNAKKVEEQEWLLGAYSFIGKTLIVGLTDNLNYTNAKAQVEVIRAIVTFQEQLHKI